MMPPIFPVASASAALKALIGSNPVRLWGYGAAPQSGAPSYGVPYVTHQNIGANPENVLAERPNADSYMIQFDVYGQTGAQSAATADALVHAIELDAHISSVIGPAKDHVTGLFRTILTVDWLHSR